MTKRKLKIETTTKPDGEKASRPAVILVDWNGTCIKEPWGGAGTWIDGAPEALKRFIDAGYVVRIHSLVHHTKEFDLMSFRDDNERWREIEATRKQLDKAGLEEVGIETTDKIPAVYMIDDKALSFQNNWQEITDKVLENERSNA